MSAEELIFEDFASSCKEGILKDDEGWKAFYEKVEAIGPNSFARRVSMGFKSEHSKDKKKMWNTIPTLTAEE